ncbi:MAG: PRC-barrel domain-containing protein [Promethearchaeota archaeon]
MPEKYPSITNAEVYELQIPGNIVGKEVIDGSARRIGIVRSLRITLPPGKVELQVKGLGVELPIDVANISAVGNVIQLTKTVKEAEEISITDVQRLRSEIWKEIQSSIMR